MHLLRRARARLHGVGEEPARTRVHRGHQLEPGREGHGPRRARNAHQALFERLAQHVEHAAIELRGLVEKQHPVMCEADLARARLCAATHEGHVRDRVVGRPEGTRGHEPLAGEQARHRVDGGHLERLLERQGRQDAREAPRQQRLARTRRPAHQHVMPPGGGNLERAAGKGLAADVGEVRRMSRRRPGAESDEGGRRRIRWSSPT